MVTRQKEVRRRGLWKTENGIELKQRQQQQKVYEETEINARSHINSIHVRNRPKTKSEQKGKYNIDCRSDFDGGMPFEIRFQTHIIRTLCGHVAYAVSSHKIVDSISNAFACTPDFNHSLFVISRPFAVEQYFVWLPLVRIGAEEQKQIAKNMFNAQCSRSSSWKLRNTNLYG